MGLRLCNWWLVLCRCVPCYTLGEMFHHLQHVFRRKQKEKTTNRAKCMLCCSQRQHVFAKTIHTTCEPRLLGLQHGLQAARKDVLSLHILVHLLHVGQLFLQATHVCITAPHACSQAVCGTRACVIYRRTHVVMYYMLNMMYLVCSAVNSSSCCTRCACSAASASWVLSSSRVWARAVACVESASTWVVRPRVRLSQRRVVAACFFLAASCWDSSSYFFWCTRCV